jgi:hypothetical protein
MSSRTPRSCQAQGAPLDPGEWPRVCLGSSLYLFYPAGSQASRLGLTGREVMPQAARVTVIAVTVTVTYVAPKSVN